VVTPVHRHLLTNREHGRVEGPRTLVLCTQLINGLIINGSVTKGGSMGVRRGAIAPTPDGCYQKIETPAWVIKPAFASKAGFITQFHTACPVIFRNRDFNFKRHQNSPVSACNSAA